LYRASKNPAHKSARKSFVLADADIFSKPANKSFVFAGGCYAFFLALAFSIVHSINYLVVFISLNFRRFQARSSSEI
jgi:hypothetical protein